MPIRDPEERRRYQREWCARRRAAFFGTQQCEWCSSRVDLELHHRDPAAKTSHAIWSWSAARRAAEIAKCVVLCRPCHQRGHAEARRIEAELRHPCGTLQAYRRGCRCASCRAANRDRGREMKARQAA